jgi:hypothetical protein
MSTLPQPLLSVAFPALLLPIVLHPPPTDHQKNVELLNELHVRHLNPLPNTALQGGEGSSSSSSSQIVSSIETVQQLFDNPSEFFEITLLSVTEFFLLHSHLKAAILSSRSHRQSSSSHSHSRDTKLNSVEQLLLWLLHISDSNVKSLTLIFGHLHRTTVYRIADHVTYCVKSELNDLIAWPTAEERKCLYGMLSICDTAVAIMDGTHCEIREPTYDEKVYYSGYKHKHTQNYLVCVNVLGVVIHVEGPFNGRKNDRSVYNHSTLGRHPESFFSEGERVLADGGFVGGAPLLVPIHSTMMDKTEDESTRETMREINREFTDNRVLVEDVFAWIKGRAHVIDSRYKRRRERQGEVFYAACRLHNFVRIHRTAYAMKK